MNNTEQHGRPTRRIAIVLAVVAVAVGAVGLVVARRGSGDADDGQHSHADNAVYACPMLCVPPTDKPGTCPVCGMALERVEDASMVNADEPVIAMSERSQELAKVATAAISRQPATADVRLTGNVAIDETRLSRVAARVPGRLDWLMADYTGKFVARHEPLYTIYSPQLLSAQEELLQSIGSGQQATLEAAREKLKLLGIAEQQIAQLEAVGVASNHVTFLSPVEGVIIEKPAVEGAYVNEGTTLYTIADLQHIWVLLDAYESDVDRIRLGQIARFSVEALPGYRGVAEVTFIDPVVDAMTRSVKVRLNVDNDDQRLRPGMFVRAILEVPLDADGAPADNEQMDELPLVVPASAPLRTGKRSIVYVETDTPGTYEGREVVLGPRAGDHYIVLEGLAEGERVVVEGNFRIDSAMQIMGRPSAMMPDDDEDPVPADDQQKAGRPQTTCPIMGGAINKDVYIDYGGYRIYFCCAGCDTQFKADADTIITRMQADGIVLENSPKD